MTTKLRPCMNCQAQSRPADRLPDGRYACRPCRRDPFRLVPPEVRAATAFLARRATALATAPPEEAPPA